MYSTDEEGDFERRMEEEVLLRACADLTEGQIEKIKNIEENRDDPWIQKLTEEEIQQIQAYIAKREGFDLERDYRNLSPDEIELIKAYTEKDPSHNKNVVRTDHWTFLDNHSHKEIIKMKEYIIKKEIKDMKEKIEQLERELNIDSGKEDESATIQETVGEITPRDLAIQLKTAFFRKNSESLWPILVRLNMPREQYIEVIYELRKMYPCDLEIVFNISDYYDARFEDKIDLRINVKKNVSVQNISVQDDVTIEPVD